MSLLDDGHRALNQARADGKTPVYWEIGWGLTPRLYTEMEFGRPALVPGWPGPNRFLGLPVREVSAPTAFRLEAERRW